MTPCVTARALLAGALAMVPAGAAPIPGMAPIGAEPTTLEEVLVVVNSHIITRRAYQQAVEQQQAEMYRAFSGKDLDEKLRGARERTLQELIDTFVLLDVATDKEMQAYAPAETELLAELKKRAQAASDADLERMVRAELGMSLSDFVRQQRQTYIIESLLYQEVYRRVPIEEQEARLYYNEHQAEFSRPSRLRVRELVIPKAGYGGGQDGLGPAETLAKVRGLLAAGGDFEELAKEFSASPSRGLGGDVGWTDKGILLPAVEDAALALAPGGVSDAVETDKDYIFVQLVGVEAEGARPFDAVREQIVAKLQEPKAKNALQLYLQSQRLRANIRYMVPKEQITKG
jgi:parvulin-like peptidyl-prolyl isomerase